MGIFGSSSNSAQEMSKPIGSPGSPRIFAGAQDYNPLPPEPNATDFTFRQVKSVNGWTIAIVHYPGCNTYDGLKCLVFACPPEKVKKQTVLDPHFLQRDDMLSPIARFAPTQQGIDLALQLCTNRPKRKNAG